MGGVMWTPGLTNRTDSTDEQQQQREREAAKRAEFTAMREQYMRGGEGFIICYSVTDRQSFQEAAKFKELIFQVRRTYEIPLVLVGNKIDLEQFRQVVLGISQRLLNGTPTSLRNSRLAVL
ncbi:GTP-binding protein Rit2 [Galemys pyrenaicus]|uniref:GTP-binding protein Rit2 n=1 Tax=Galemys pyrenaicus TaxID=202257 RepID=A0A8J6AII3_GALPY|nr:GTP-binding protein Rit2 [Galemys pyrenaicus]